MVLNIRIWAFQEQVPFKLSFSIQKWLTIIFHLWMTLGTAPARMYAKNENKVHYLWPLWASLACVRKVKLLGNTSPPPGFLTSLKVVLIFVNNLWLMRLISCQQTKSFYNAHSFRVCISWRFEGFLPLFRVVPFPLSGMEEQQDMVVSKAQSAMYKVRVCYLAALRALCLSESELHSCFLYLPLN